MLEVDVQPRIDVLVDDANTGDRRRWTTYAGVVWLGGRVDAGATFRMSSNGVADTPLILPDSLAYDTSKLGDAVVTASFATATTSGGDLQPAVALRSVGFVPDPQGRPPAWVQLHLFAKGHLPIGVTYRVEVLSQPDPVLPAP